MTEAPDATKFEPNPEFEEQLDRAFASPKSASLKGKPETTEEELEERGEYFSTFSAFNENVKLRSFESPDYPYQVITDDPAQLLLLLAQAARRLEIAKGMTDPGIVVTPELERTAEHELAHGRMAKALGVGSRFGVSVLHDEAENIWALSPFHSEVGNAVGEIMLTRLEEAAIAVAPEDPSPTDLRSVEALGYTSREEVLEKLYASHPHLKPTA